MSLVDAAIVGSRLLQFAGAAVLAGSPLFFLYGVMPGPDAGWPRRLVLTAALAGSLGTVGWLMAQAAQIGDPGGAFVPATVWSVAAETSFGHAALARLALFLAALVTAAGRPARSRWIMLAAAGVLVAASLAWTGHGARDEGGSGVLHLTADVLHSLAAAVWIGALAPLAISAWLALRGDARAGEDELRGLVRFSAIGATVVSVLAASGLANSWYLVGPEGVGRLLSDLYGRVLLAKVALFAAMLLLAAANRFRHTPRLERAMETGVASATAFRPIVVSLLCETILALAVLAAVSWLGTLSPTVDGPG